MRTNSCAVSSVHFFTALVMKVSLSSWFLWWAYIYPTNSKAERKLCSLIFSVTFEKEKKICELFIFVFKSKSKFLYGTHT